MFFEWLVVALLVAMLSFFVWQDFWHYKGPHRATDGDVIGHRSSIEDGSTTYMARVSYTDHLGQRHEIEDTVGRAEPTPAIGATLRVHYPVSTPERGRVHRPVLRLVIYGVVLAMLAAMAAKMMGWVG
jgi:hypothetical protein